MGILEKTQTEIDVLKTEQDKLIESLRINDTQKKALSDQLQESRKKAYIKSLYLCHIKEIFRIAKIQFSRLYRRPIDVLTSEDILELNKWINRVKSEDGLRDILDALNELSKYSPGQIRSSVYALTQKIIIGGAFKSVRKK